MKYFFCFIPKEDAKHGSNIGKIYAYKNKAKWVEANWLSGFLTVGYVKGCDFVVNDNKTYLIMKSFIDITEKSVVFLAVESISGCDVE